MSIPKPPTDTPSNSESTPSKNIATKNKSYPIRALVILTATVLLVSYVESMIIPAVPIIQKELSTTSNIASWSITIVLLMGAVVSPILGKLGDIYGKKKIIIVTLVFYTVGVSIAGFSTSIYFLIFARGIQGVGLAMIPLALALLTDIFPKEKLATAQGAIAGSAAISTALGLVVGAYVVQILGWQYAFHTAAILSVVLLVSVIVVLKRDVSCVAKCRIDYASALILSAGIALILIFLTEGPILGWLSLEEFLFLIPGLALTFFFFIFERKVSAPLIQLKLLEIRNVLIANLVTIIAGLTNYLVFFGVIYYAELPKPYGLGFDVLNTGLTLAPGTIAMFIIGPIVGKLVTKIGPKPILITGSSISIISFILFIVNRGSASSVTIDVIVAFAGIVSLYVPLVNMISVSLPKDSVSVGQGLNSTLKSIGKSFGPVLTTTILASYTLPIIENINGNATIVGTVPSVTAFDIIFAVGIAFAIVCIALSLAIRNDTFKKKNGGTT
jgi:MFS family permease